LAFKVEYIPLYVPWKLKDTQTNINMVYTEINTTCNTGVLQ